MRFAAAVSSEVSVRFGCEGRTCGSSADTPSSKGDIVFAAPLALSTTKLPEPAIVPFYRVDEGEDRPPSTRRQHFLVFRRNTSSRHILNQDAIAAALAPVGSVQGGSQARRCLSSRTSRRSPDADIMVGAPGTGLANMVFTNPDADVLELTHSRFNGISSYDPPRPAVRCQLRYPCRSCREPREGEQVPKRARRERSRLPCSRPDAVVGAVKTLIGAQ